MNELERIFSDAHLIDFDLSRWDKQLELLILADHFENYSNRKPLLKVCFGKLESLELKFNNMGLELDEEWQHCQWNICELQCCTKKNRKEYRLIGDKPSPDIFLTCENVTFEKLDYRVLDRLFPQWEDPYSPLARRGIEDIYSMLFARKK